MAADSEAADGGGICISCTLMFTAMLHPLTVGTDNWPVYGYWTHSYDISTLTRAVILTLLTLLYALLGLSLAALSATPPAPRARPAPRFLARAGRGYTVGGISVVRVRGE